MTTGRQDDRKNNRDNRKERTMKKVCRAVAGMALWGAMAWGQEAPVPGDGATSEAAGVPPVILRDVRVQSIGEERWNEVLPPGLIFIDAEDGDLCIADEDNPHGRVVCPCKNVDRHSFTNDLKINGHRILLNDAFSLQAEGSAVSLRHGTNAILQVLAEDYGNLAPLTAAFEDETHLLLTANAPADAVLQTTTNLLDEAGWQTATNAVIVETTDAATTWRITLLDGPVPEFYRVLASVSREAGIYANAALHAEAGVVIPEGQGVTMGTNTWNEWPDVGTIATNAANAAVADRATVDALAEVAGGVSTNAGDIATNAAAIGALDGRVAALEYPDECRLFWSRTWLQSNSTNTVPTNYPTKNLEIFVTDAVATNVVIDIPSGWEPPHNTRIDIFATAASSQTNRSIGFTIGGTLVERVTTQGTRRHWQAQWETVSRRWHTRAYAFGFYNYVYTSTGGQEWDYFSGAPATVDEWEAIRTARQSGDGEQVSYMSSVLSPSLSPVVLPSLTPELSPLVFEEQVFEEDELAASRIDEQEEELETE